jgi:hypothetical protein
LCLLPEAALMPSAQLAPGMQSGPWATLAWIQWSFRLARARVCVCVCVCVFVCVFTMQWSCRLSSLRGRRRAWREHVVYAQLQSRCRGLQGRGLRAWRSLVLFREMEDQAFKVAGGLSEREGGRGGERKGGKEGGFKGWMDGQKEGGRAQYEPTHLSADIQGRLGAWQRECYLHVPTRRGGRSAW